MKKIFATLLVITCLFLISCSTENGQTTNDSSTDTNNASTAQSSFDVSEFQTKDLKGQSFDNSIFQDYELTLVNVWATWCPPCIAEIPDLGELANEMKADGVNIIGIVQDAVNEETFETNTKILDKAISIMESSNADYTVLLPDKILYSTFISKVRYFPTTFFVDKNGNFVGQPVIGAKSKKDWETSIYQYKELLG